MKYALYFAFLLIATCFAACEDEHPQSKVAKPTMEKEAFINLLVDARILEGAYSVRYQRIDSASGMLNSYYDQVFQKHGTNRAEFKDNFIAYSVNTELMTEIEDSVLARLERIPLEIAPDTASYNLEKTVKK